jgi:energy-coupling factor transporter ATP-binding protein EcfA2
MWVQAIELRRWRCFERVRLEGFAPGLNLLHGPNEAGKSTLLNAMARLLLDRPKTTGARDLRPWGTELNPEGALELEAGGLRYRIEKRFHPTSGSALLQVDRGLGWADLRQDEAVQEFVHELVGGQPAAKGLSKYEQWGLLRLLWALQDETVLPPELDGELQRRLGPLIGPDPLGDPGQVEPLLQKVRERYARWFTPTGKEVRGARASPLVALQEEERELEQEVARLRADLQTTRELAQRLREELDEEKEFERNFVEHKRERERLDQLGREYSRLRSRRSEAERRLEKARAEAAERHGVLAQLKQAAIDQQKANESIQVGQERLFELKAQQDKAAQERAEAERGYEAGLAAHEGARQALEAARSRHARLSRLREGLHSADGARAREQAVLRQLQAAELSERKAREEESEALAALQRAQVQEQQALRALEEAQRALEEAKLFQERRELAEKLRQLTELEARIERLSNARAELQPASAEDLERIEQIDSEMLEQRAIVQAERVQLEVRAERDLRTVVRVDGRLEEEPLSARAIARYEGVELRLVLPGIATILVGRPGAGQQAATRLESLRQEKAEIFARYSAADLQSLRVATQKARDLEHDLERCREERRNAPGRAQIEGRLAVLPKEAHSLEVAAQRCEAAGKEHKARKAEQGKALRDLEAANAAADRAGQEAQARRQEHHKLLGRTEAMAEQLGAQMEAEGLPTGGAAALERALAEAAEACAEAERAAHEAETRCGRLRLERDAAQKKAVSLENKISAVNAELRQHEIALDAARTRRLSLLDGRGEEELRSEELDAHVRRAQSELDALPQLPPVDPEQELEQEDKALKQLEQEWDQRRRKQLALEQKLEELRLLGLWEKLGEAEEKLALCRRSLALERLKAQAAAHLKELLEAAQDEARRKLGGPIRSWIAVRAREVLGDSDADVLFSGGMALEKMARHNVESPAPVAELSRGARDQLGLLVRLAIAEHVSKQERQLVVLDDVLVHADASRRRRLLKILQEASAQVQVLICTCHPDQYAGLGEEARRFDLEQIKAGQS